ncbi:growth hormone-regulated TBC protein 1 isoform X2 [Bos taurus]|nr:growth hormone-regulated TBC protein 1 isoform X2 [Bos taurus]
MGVSGAQARMDRNPGYYQRLLQGERSASLEEAIRTDMNRTFPDNVRFRKDAEPCLQGPLYNVLLAYGHHNHGVGYCQGMNFIAGYLILVTKSEEEAFWLLDALVGRILPADYYSPSMLGLKTDQEVLGELVRTKLPAVAALMHSHGVLWTLVASRWFICLFVDVLPVETVLRVWDCLFSEGSKIIFRVALTLLKHHQASILEATSVPDLCEKFKEITRGRFVTECHSFMQVGVSHTGPPGDWHAHPAPPTPSAVGGATWDPPEPVRPAPWLLLGLPDIPINAGPTLSPPRCLLSRPGGVIPVCPLSLGSRPGAGCVHSSPELMTWVLHPTGPWGRGGH